MIKNTAGQAIGCQMTSAADGSNFTGTVTVYITKDNGTQTIGSVGSGICTHEGNGYHSYAPSQGETDADHIAFTFIGSGAISKTLQAFTRTGDSFSRLGAPAGASVSADIAALDTVADGIQTDLDNATDGLGAIKGSVDGIQTDLDNATDGLGALKALIDAIDAVVDAVKLVTDNLPNSGSLNDLATLAGRLTATRAAYLDELDFDLQAGITGLSTDVGNLNDLSAAEVNAECDQALSDYDPPTKAEQDAAFTEIKGSGFSATDTLEAIRDKETDIETDTAEIGVAGAGLTDVAIGTAGIQASSYAANARDAASQAADAVTEIQTAVKSFVAETQGSYTFQQILSILLSACAGVTADGGATLKTPNGSATRITGTINGSNERTSMSLTPST